MCVCVCVRVCARVCFCIHVSVSVCLCVLCALCVDDLIAWWIIVMYLYMCVVFVCACMHACCVFT